MLAQVVKKYSHDVFGDQISRLIGEKRYVECIQLIRRSISEMEQEVVKPRVIGTLKKRFTQTENFLEQLLNTHLYRFANNGEFEQGTYEEVIGGLQVLWGDAHMFYSKYQQILDNLFTQSINEQFDTILYKYHPSNPLKNIQGHIFNSVLRDIYERLTALLYNHHLLVRYHLNQSRQNPQNLYMRDFADYLVKKQRPQLVQRMDHQII